MDFTTLLSNVRFADLSNIAQIKRWGSITFQNGNKVGKLLCRNVQTHLIQKMNNLYRVMFFIKDNTSHDNAGLVSNYSWEYACTKKTDSTSRTSLF